jgi:RHS repeat-associated protein
MFTYDGNGQRVIKKVQQLGAVQSESITVYLYDLFGDLIMETTPSGDPNKVYVYGREGVLWQYDYSAIDPSLKEIYFHSDYKGNVVRLSGADGKVKQAYEYDPWGNIIESKGVVQNNPFRYDQKYFDFETGLYYYGARYYNPRYGIWLSRDPIVANVYSAMDNNPYQFCYNNPNTYSDYAGMAVFNPGFGWGDLLTVTGMLFSGGGVGGITTGEWKKFVFDLILSKETVQGLKTAAVKGAVNLAVNGAKDAIQTSRNTERSTSFDEGFKENIRHRIDEAPGIDQNIKDKINIDDIMNLDYNSESWRIFNDQIRTAWNEGDPRHPLPKTIKEASRKNGWIEYQWPGNYYHQDPTTPGMERKFVNRQTGQEVVFYSNGRIVVDPRFRGTFNYANVTGQFGLYHGQFDVDPYKHFGY